MYSSRPTLLSHCSREFSCYEVHDLILKGWTPNCCKSPIIWIVKINNPKITKTTQGSVYTDFNFSGEANLLFIWGKTDKGRTAQLWKKISFRHGHIDKTIFFKTTYIRLRQNNNCIVRAAIHSNKVVCTISWRRIKLLKVHHLSETSNHISGTLSITNYRHLIFRSEEKTRLRDVFCWNSNIRPATLGQRSISFKDKYGGNTVLRHGNCIY